MSIPRDALYTPGCIQIDLMVTRAALLAEPYRLRIIASVAGEVVHERMMTLMRGKKTSCELPVPEVRATTEIRCRAELLLGDEFIEACEKPVRLWPPRCPREVTHHGMRFWALDPSGIVQKLLSESGIAPSNAAFQAVRDFSTPRVVVVGEALDPSNIQMILDRVGMMDEDTVVVLLRQEQFPEPLQVSITGDEMPAGGVVREHRSILLDGLTACDVMGLLNDAHAIHVREVPGRALTSPITGAMQINGEVCSYLCVIQEGRHRILCCQLPSTDCQDPRQMTLFHNLIRFACEQVHSTTPREATDTERIEP